MTTAAGGALLAPTGWLILAALASHEAWWTVRHAFKCNHHDKCTCWPSHRFLAGRTFHGHVVTDATYWKRADKVKTKTQHCSPFQKLPGYQRRLARTGPVLAAGGGLIDPVATAAAVALVAVVLLLEAAPARRAVRWACGQARKRLAPVVSAVVPDRVAEWSGRLIEERAPRFTEHHGARTQDIAQALATITGTSAAAVKRGIEWNPGYAAAEQGAMVAKWYLPRGFKGDSKERAKANELWQGRVGFELTPQWNLADARPHVNFIRARSLPDIVYLEEYAPYLAKLPPWQIGLGLDDMGELVCLDWKTENPHHLTVAGSRIGKTELNRSKVAQVTRKGGLVAGADCKRISFQGLEGIPGFELENNPRNIRGMWELVRRSYDVMEARAEERENNPTAEFDPFLVCVEELGQFSSMTDDWWEELEFEDPRDAGSLFFKRRNNRKTPRVWRYIKSLCFEGAEFEMHVDISGQDGDHQYLKGVKPVLGLRMLGGYQDNQWINCVGTRPVPQAPDIKGRFCLVNGRKQTWFQAFVGALDKLESAAIWRDYARAGRRMDGSPGPVTGPFTVSGNGTIHTPVPAGQRVATVPRPEAVTEATLQEICDMRILRAPSKRALEMDRYRSDKGELPPGVKFPEPVRVERRRGGDTEIFNVAEVVAFDTIRRPAASSRRAS